LADFKAVSRLAILAKLSEAAPGSPLTVSALPVSTARGPSPGCDADRAGWLARQAIASRGPGGSRHELTRRREAAKFDYYVATVPELPVCHTQAKSLDDLMSRIQDAISLYLETEGSSTVGNFVGGPGCSS